MIISDFHVHFHKKYNKDIFFNSIKNNFLNYYKKENLNCTHHIVCLAESAGTSFFKELSSFYNTSVLDSWSFNPTNSNNTIIAIHDSGFRIHIIAGRQIVTSENLEVLAIGMIEEIEDGKSIESVIRSVILNNSIPIVPWGFGKWIGTRKKIVEKLVESNNHYPFYLGDNGNRPSLMGRSPIFKIAENKKIYNLQGSDPLPFNNEERRPGSYGVLIDETLQEDYPFESLKIILKSKNINITTYGNTESVVKFFKHQIGMQIIKRLRK